jgi:hypothetical protein
MHQEVGRRGLVGFRAKELVDVREESAAGDRPRVIGPPGLFREERRQQLSSPREVAGLSGIHDLGPAHVDLGEPARPRGGGTFVGKR